MTHEYHATVEWERQDVSFIDNKYSRGHVWRFDGGVEVPASSAVALFMSPLDSAAAYPLMTQSGHRESAEG